jgi:RNA polymerase sigma-70 factor, ECF subfamily
MIPHSIWPSSLEGMARRMLAPIPVTAIHADKISVAKKGASLSQETVVISVRDKELILQRAQKRDPEALNLLFESCRGRLFASALRILPRQQDAEDAVQDAMLAAFTHMDKFQGRADFLTWATRIVINAALMQIRRARSKPVISWDQVNGEIEESFSSEFVEDKKPTPEQIYQQVEQRRLLEEALWQLPADHRRAVQLCKLMDCSLNDAARALGVSIGTIKARLHRGRRSLLLRIKGKTQHRYITSRSRKALPPCLAADSSLRAA